jgi:hypothetical protein
MNKLFILILFIIALIGLILIKIKSNERTPVNLFENSLRDNSTC